MKKNAPGTFSGKVKAAEKNLTKGLLKWRLRQQGRPLPDDAALDSGAQRIVEEANRVVKKSGRGLWGQLKDARNEFLKAYNDEDEGE